MTRPLFGGWFKKRSGGAQSSWDRAVPLLQWSDVDPWTIGDAVEGTLVLGATGSGKTSGSGRAIATSMLRRKFGGLVLTAKSDECQTWLRYARECGREDDVVVFGVESPWTFNPIDLELRRAGIGAGLTENIVQMIGTILEVGDRGSGSGRDNDGYWRKASQQLCRNLVDLLAIAKGRITIPDIYRLAVSAPTSLEQVRSDEWRSKSLCWHCLGEGLKREKTPRQAADFELVADYFLREFPALADKTRSVVVSTLSSTIDVLNRGALRELFCGDTNLTPQAAEEGKIIIVDLPVKEFGEVGQFAQVLWKYAFQRSIERRVVTPETRPVFLWADEMQNFVTSYDMQFQTTCRSALVATVLLTQNVSNVYAALGGGEKGRAEAASLFANLNTKIFHAQTDPVTNEWAASIVGRSLHQFGNASSSSTPEERMNGALGMRWLTHPGNTSAGFSESYDFEVQPAVFTQLRTGGRAHAGIVDAIVVRNGRKFESTGKSWTPATFRQDL